MRQEISFYSEALGKRLSGSYLIEGGILTVFCDDGRKMETQARESGEGGPEYLARQMLIELEREKRN
jgi:hypothetical protein